MSEIIEHELVPKHEILSAKERGEVLKAFEATEAHIPRILISDVIVEMIGAKDGDIIKITRQSETAGKSVYYRIVED